MPPQSQNPTPVMDVVAPPVAEKPVANSQDGPVQPPADAEHSAPKAHANKVTKQTAPPKQPGNGVGMAIFATVIIVLGLAAMATYAYLKTV